MDRRKVDSWARVILVVALISGVATAGLLVMREPPERRFAELVKFAAFVAISFPAIFLILMLKRSRGRDEPVGWVGRKAATHQATARSMGARWAVNSSYNSWSIDPVVARPVVARCHPSRCTLDYLAIGNSCHRHVITRHPLGQWTR